MPLHLVWQRPVLPSRDPGWPDWKNLHKLVQSFSDMSDVPEGFGKTIPILHGYHHLGGVTPPGQKHMTVYHIEIRWDMFDNVISCPRLCADVRHTLAWSCRTDTIKIKKILQTTKNSTRNCRKNVKIHYTVIHYTFSVLSFPSLPYRNGSLNPTTQLLPAATPALRSASIRPWQSCIGCQTTTTKTAMLQKITE